MMRRMTVAIALREPRYRKDWVVGIHDIFAVDFWMSAIWRYSSVSRGDGAAIDGASDQSDVVEWNDWARMPMG